MASPSVAIENASHTSLLMIKLSFLTPTLGKCFAGVARRGIAHSFYSHNEKKYSMRDRRHSGCLPIGPRHRPCCPCAQ